MNRKFWIVAGLVIVTASVAGGFRTRATRHRTASVSSNAAHSAAEKFEADRIENDYREAISTVEENYAGEVDYEKATQAAIQGMLFTLDPHSVFFPTVEFKKLKEDQASSFYGIGVQITRHDDGVYVQSVVADTPAARAGLRYGDRIVEVAGKDARDWRSEYHEAAVYKSNGSDPEDLPLVVLINRNTASASEIVAGAIQDHGRGLVVGETSFGKGLVQHVFQLPYGTGLTLTTARYYTPYGRSLQRDYSSGSLYDYYVRHEENENQQPIQPGQPSPNETVPSRGSSAPAFRTAAGRVFYGGGGITPDIEARPLTGTAVRGRIIEAVFMFTRMLAAGKIPGLESYRVDRVNYGRSPRATDYPVNDRVLEAFRNYVRKDQAQRLPPGQIDTDLEFVKLRLREEIVTAAYGADAGQRVLLESDPQVLRSIGVLPDAKRLAESVRNGTPISFNFRPLHRWFMPASPALEEADEILV